MTPADDDLHTSAPGAGSSAQRQTSPKSRTSPDGPVGLHLRSFRGLRPAVAPDRIGNLLCPPYDVIDDRLRNRLLDLDPDNIVEVILPEPTTTGYRAAVARLVDLEQRGIYRLDETPAIYVYEMQPAGETPTRGLLGAVELRDPADGVILPHENTMAGPVADRLEVMTATGADLEPIYLVYDGGGTASRFVRDVDTRHPVVETVTPDGVTHRLWTITDPDALEEIDADLAGRHALIADGHHRYATYRERQRRDRATKGSGPWDRGMTLLVDSSDYGPQVHAIHRVVPGLRLDDAVRAIGDAADVQPCELDQAVTRIEGLPRFAAVLTDGSSTVTIEDTNGELASSAARPGESSALNALDVTVVHRGLVEHTWSLSDDVDTVRYAHSADEAVEQARLTNGIAVLLRPTPVAAVAAVAAAGGRMPRKSTLFTPKPASGLVLRRLADG